MQGHVQPTHNHASQRQLTMDLELQGGGGSSACVHQHVRKLKANKLGHNQCAGTYKLWVISKFNLSD